MIEGFISGMLLGFAYAAPIGAQNLFVIHNASRIGLPEGYIVAFCTAFHDIALAACCFWGMGVAIEKLPFLKLVLLTVGSLFLLKIGYGIIKSAKDISMEKTDDDQTRFSIIKIFLTAAALTWLNPQALIDGSILLGGFQASLDPSVRTLFFTGVAIASASWFVALTSLIGYLKREKKNHLLKYISITCGVLLIIFALKMGYDAYDAFKGVSL